MNVKYWLSSLISEKMELSWLAQWRFVVQKAEQENCEVVAFAIPKKENRMIDTKILSEIEYIIQNSQKPKKNFEEIIEELKKFAEIPISIEIHQNGYRCCFFCN